MFFLPLLELCLISCHILRIHAADCQTLIPLHHIFYVRTVVSTVVGNIVFLVVVVVDILELRIVCAESVPAPRVEQPELHSLGQQHIVTVLLLAAGIDIIDVTVITAKKNRKSCKKEREHENKTDNSKACRMA